MVIKFAKFLVVFLMFAGLAACSDEIVLKTGAAPTTRMKIDSCLDSCKRDHDSCNDSAGAERTQGRQFGAAQQCDRVLKNCFKECKIIDPRNTQ